MVSKSHPAGRPDNLICVSETRAHHLSLISVFLIVVVDADDRRNSRILVGRDLRAIVLFLMPIVNAPTNGESNGTPASAHATPCANLHRSVRLQRMPSFSRISVARVPSQVLAILIRTRSRLTPFFSYSDISFRALATKPAVSKLENPAFQIRSS
jgi:hypothetical protein